MYILSNYTEFTATFFNILSNICMFLHVYKTPNEKVPMIIVCFQVLANTSWIISSVLLKDIYLTITASGSLCLQTVTMVLLMIRNSKDKNVVIKQKNIKADTSLDQLLKF